MKSVLAYNKDYAFNAICPYYTMFPLEYPLGLIGKHRRNDPIILDPFCGRGTTLYAARKLGFNAYGLDTSPIAAAIAQAKLASARLEDVMALAEKLVATEAKDVPSTLFFEKAFSSSTLLELCSMREGLLKVHPSSEAAILRAAALGCLHGPLPTANGTPSYFSNQMPRTFSSKPDYSVRFWDKRGIMAPQASVLDVIRKKLARINDLDSPSGGGLTNVVCTDARSASSYRTVGKATVTITSPPYYGMRTYVEDQWLRNWFIGGPSEPDYGNNQQLRHTGQSIFVTDLAKVWKNVHSTSEEEAHLYIRFGAIPSVKSDPRELLKASLDEAGGWRLISVRNARTSRAGKRQAVQMGRESEPAIEFDFHAIRA
ncbi:DNA methyltransferase [Agrobacterium radiobacter]|uniref:DNA methyltransferase n=1 Tax=Agrobacterium radiobacter TaxID=362 RepID=UPI003CE4734B